MKKDITISQVVFVLNEDGKRSLGLKHVLQSLSHYHPPMEQAEKC